MTEFKHPKYTKDELELICTTFKNNDQLLKIMRKVFFQVPLNEKEAQIANTAFSFEDLKHVLRKQFLPSLADDWGIGHEVDSWYGMGIEARLTENAVQIIRARAKTITYITETLKVLFNEPVESTIDFNELTELEGKTDTEIFINFYSRNEINARVQNCLRDLKALSDGTPTTAELLAKKQKDSNK